jgi:hypothetical protein
MSRYSYNRPIKPYASTVKLLCEASATLQVIATELMSRKAEDKVYNDSHVAEWNSLLQRCQNFLNDNTHSSKLEDEMPF